MLRPASSLRPPWLTSLGAVAGLSNGRGQETRAQRGGTRAQRGETCAQRGVSGLQSHAVSL